ncbi:MAG TPA: multicopper oxidase domain-containing protein [Cyclobacteriaceae bacterium]|nr:multicopper oxidase domain-containing protein [Cyclobacteriaceae bacterium]HRF32446.1 multicopper oxidase domain-containing protein [Cyclobacteriaceae bacterium]
MKRREFIKTSGLSAITAWAGSSLLLSACHTEEDMIGEDNWIVEGSFNQPLFRPAIVEGNTSLNVQTTTGQMLNGSSSSILSYRNGLLGNTIKATQGGTVSIQVQNNLSEETNIHWHGLIVPEDMDGHPKDLIAGGGSFTYTLPINQRAGTYWYHPHPHEATARQVFMGLAGMFIVTDSEEAALNLPSGDFEIPLIIQDKRFSGSSLDYSPSEDEIMMGYLGEHIIVNGIYAPVASIAKGWQRLRVLNGSTARVYNLAFSNGMSFHVIGADGGLLATPENVNSLMLAPGERADVLVDFSGIALGQSVYLQSKKFSQYNVQGRQQFNIMKFVMEQATAPAFTLPATLSKINTIPAASAVRTRTFDIAALVGGMGGHGGMGRHSIGGKTFQMDRVDETVQANTTEIWEFDNRMGDEIHPMHIHGVQFQILERTGGRGNLIATEKGWKDTVLVMPGEKVRVIMTFPSYTGVFVFHCHNLEHEDDGMMLNFEII